MFLPWPISFMLCVFIQNLPVPSFSSDIFNSAEKSKLEKADTIERRIKIYQDASARIQRAIQDAVSKEDFPVVPDNLKTWTSLLSESLKDIEANINPKKRKSRALINFEIHLRKSIVAANTLKIRSPFDQQDIFDSSLARAEKIRKRFVELLFPR